MLGLQNGENFLHLTESERCESFFRFDEVLWFVLGVGLLVCFWLVLGCPWFVLGLFLACPGFLICFLLIPRETEDKLLLQKFCPL